MRAPRVAELRRGALALAVLDEAGLDQEQMWALARAKLDALGGLAAERLSRDSRGLLRPLGDCDVVTLLGSRTLRTALAEDAHGMGAAVVPMRTRGWTRL